MRLTSDLHEPDRTSYQFVLEKTGDNAIELENFLVNFRKSGKDWMIVAGITRGTDRLMSEIADTLSNELNGMVPGERIFFRIVIDGAELSLHIERADARAVTHCRDSILKV